MQYDTDISKLTPNLRIDGDSYAPEGEQNFDNETKSLVIQGNRRRMMWTENTLYIFQEMVNLLLTR